MLRRSYRLPSSLAAHFPLLRPCVTSPHAGQQPPRTRCDERSRRPFSRLPAWRQEARPETSYPPDQAVVNHIEQERPLPSRKLPVVCPGCGAHSQTVDPDTPGYYGAKRSRSVVKKESLRQEDDIYRAAMAGGSLPNSLTPQGQGEDQPQQPTPSPTIPIPICDRCHTLLHQSHGTPIVHPTMLSIQSIIEESPHKHNHIYHILDAADFPMSLIPHLRSALHLPPLRSRNRRAKTVEYAHGKRLADVSFIITRSDLLAPKKEQVDAMMPYLQEVLREALGRSARNVRLGNVRCVSSKRGWWTKTVKEEVWGRGGAGWMVGRVNVGKSALLGVIFPKGRGEKKGEGVERESADGREALDEGSAKAEVREEGEEDAPAFADSPGELGEGGGNAAGDAEHASAFVDSTTELSEGAEKDNDAATAIQDDALPPQESSLQPDPAAKAEQPEANEAPFDEPFDEDEDASLLPPAQPETPYPAMPLVSALPGTTASPIRLPFGTGKGELIDLPGIHRSDLSQHVKPAHHKDMVMTSRVVPEQHLLRPGQSLLLGGLIRVSYKSKEDEGTGEDKPVILAYPFVPPAFTPHVTGTHKAIAIQSGVHSAASRGREGEVYSGTVESIATEEAREVVGSAGRFRLGWDVTKRRAGPLTDPVAGKLKTDALPFIVYSTDILIEGVGWVELVCQVRKRSGSFIGAGEEVRLPEVEVFSPEGKYVGVRKPMCAWLVGGRKAVAVHKQRARPRQTISMQRRREGGRRSAPQSEG